MNRDQAIIQYESTLAIRPVAKKTRERYMEYARSFVAYCKDNKSKFPTAEDAIVDFLSSLAPCSVSNQRGALAALAGRNGFYKCLGREIGKLPEWVLAKRPERIPTWLTRSEAEAVIAQLPDPWNLMAALMYSSGLRIGETCNLRWQAFDFERLTVSIWSGKGDKSRIAPLSRRLVEPLMARRARCRGLWEEDRKNKRPGVAPPDSMVRKFPSCGLDWPYFFVFPAKGESRDPESGIIRRHHIHDKSFSRPMRIAVRRSGIDKRATAHAFRHGFATAYLIAGGNIRELQDRLGHESIETTMRYLHCLPQNFDRIGSPWDIAEPSREFTNIIPLRKGA